MDDEREARRLTFAQRHIEEQNKLDEANRYKNRSAWHSFKYGFFENRDKNFLPGLISWLSPSWVPTPLRGGLRPPTKAFLTAARGSYKSTAEKLPIPDFTLVYETPTFAAWLNENTKTILIGVRGTKEKKDVAAWIPSATDTLGNTARYQESLADFNKILSKYNPEEYEYYAAGHSLGGAIVSKFVRDFPDVIKGAVVFNSAAEPSDFWRPNDHIITRYYFEGDPLYKLYGHRFKYIKLIKSPPKNWLYNLYSYLPNIPNLYYNTKSLLAGHELNNFDKAVEGQGRSIKCKKCGGYK